MAEILLCGIVLSVMGGLALFFSSIQKKNNTPELIEKRYQEYMLALKKE